MSAADQGASPSLPQRSLGWLECHGSAALVLVVAGVVAIALLYLLPGSVHVDTWLGLVDGRFVAKHGIPHRDPFTTYTLGHTWIDEQWLSQLLMYWLERIGGLVTVGLCDIALIVAAILGCAAAARRLGASAASIARVLPLAVLQIAITTEVRTQSFAYPLFVATIFLLARDARRGDAGVYWCLPLLVGWANMHGSATLGAGLVGLRGLTILYERRRALRHVREWFKPIVLVLGAIVALLATPYGFAVIAYYRHTVLNPDFASFVTEWQPVTTQVFAAVPFFVTVAVVVWSFGRHPGQLRLWDRLALLALATGTIIAVRNLPWFAMATAMLLPLSIDRAVRAREPAPGRPTLNLAMVATVAALLVLELVRTIAAGPAALGTDDPARGLAATTAAAARLHARVFADERYADWLLWADPSLGGRVAYDARLELLTRGQLARIVALKNEVGPDYAAAASGDRLLMLADTSAPQGIAGFEREPGATVLYRGSGLVVIERTPAAAGGRG